MDEPRPSPPTDEALPSLQAPDTSPQGPPHAAPPPMHTVFVGPEGLRAGWRFFVYLAIAGSFLFLIGLANQLWQPRLELWQELIEKSEMFAAAIAAAFIMAKLEGRVLSVYGLPHRLAFGKLFWAGALGGIAALTVLMLAMRAAGLVEFDGLAVHGARLLKFGAFYALFFVVVGLSEEFITRGYTQFTLTQGMGFWPAAVVLSAAFGCIHLGNPGETWIGIAGATAIGFFFCLTLRRTGNLWFAVGFHASWDWGESYFYSVPDSGTLTPGHLLHEAAHGPQWLTGGPVGPEGSVLLFVLLALLWVVFSKVYPDVKYPAPVSCHNTSISS